jgi:transcriptional regulator GlxA family with amidase domain
VPKNAAAGVTAGIDGALHIVERLLGKEAAHWTAVEWMEHARRQSTGRRSRRSRPAVPLPAEHDD